MRANQRRVLVGPDAYAIDFISRLPAGFCQRIVRVGATLRLKP
ncbi:hypothetical protein AB0D29_18435 [Streptomyces sp. NPDC048424]